MKIKLKSSPEQVELVQLMASKDRNKSYEAQAAISTLLAPLVAELFLQADITNLLYEDLPYNQGEDPSFPLDLYAHSPEGTNTIWSQNIAGGIPTNQVLPPINELRFTTYKIDSAISYDKKYAAMARLDVVGKALTQLMQEISLKQQKNAWAPFFFALANAAYTSLANNGGTALPSVWRTLNAGYFTLADLNKMFTGLKRLNSSWVGGTTEEKSSLTDLFLSPEIKEQIRGFAYQPVNTQGANVIAGTAASGVIALPEEERAKIFNSAGIDTIFNVALHELNELGINYKFGQLFQYAAGTNTFATYANSGAATFNSASSDLIIGVDANRTTCYRPVEKDADTGSTFTLVPDDQFFVRSNKIGLYGSLTEGRTIIDMRNAIANIV